MIEIHVQRFKKKTYLKLIETTHALNTQRV